MKNRVFVLVTLLSITWILQSQDFEYEEFRRDGETLKYRILYPENFHSNEEYPVVLFLHGAGERGNDNEKQLVHGSKHFLSSEFREMYPAVVLFPQCSEEDYWSNAKIDRSSTPITLKYKRKGKATKSMKLAIQLIDSIAELDYSKNDQLYVGGLSMGGMGTYEMLSRKPELFAAAIAICGGGQPKNVIDYVSTAIWVFHGSNDNVVLPKYSTRMVLAMQEAGGKVRYSLFPQANHNSWDPAFAEKELFPWLFSHTKVDIK